MNIIIHFISESQATDLARFLKKKYGSTPKWFSRLVGEVQQEGASKRRIHAYHPGVSSEQR